MVILGRMFPKTISTDQGKPDQAVPVANGCALPGAASTGELTGSPIPIPTTGDAALLAQEIISGEPDFFTGSARALFAGLLRRHWRNQADGFFE